MRKRYQLRESQVNNGEPEIPPDNPVELPPDQAPVDIPPGGPIEEPSPPSEVPPEPPIELPPTTSEALTQRMTMPEAIV